MFKRMKAWLLQSYPCRYCGGTGYESNLRMVGNHVRSWGFVALAIVVLVMRFWPAPARAPGLPPLIRPGAPGPR